MSIKSKLVNSKQSTLIIMSILIPCSILFIFAAINWTQQLYAHENILDGYRDKAAFEKCTARVKDNKQPGWNWFPTVATSEDIAKAKISEPALLSECQLKWGKWKKIKPKPFTSFISKDVGAIIFALAIIFYIVVYTIVLYARCDNLGWKRLAIISSVVPSVAAGYLMYDNTQKVAAMLVFAIAGYVVSVFVILGGQRLALWIKDGFDSSS